jgi:2,5-diketo-D-gluconate reductase B
MEWTYGTVTKEDPVRRIDRTFPALFRPDGTSVMFKADHHGQCFFTYKATGVAFNFIGTRRAPDGTLTDSWSVDMTHPKRILIETCSREFVRQKLPLIEQDIESALLKDPSWPSHFGRPELPVRGARFVYGIPDLFDGVNLAGLFLPQLGLGTYRMRGTVCQAAVESALAQGYRHIDTAPMYENEDAIAAAIDASELPRREIFLTSKVCHGLATPEEARASLDESLRRLETNYLDLCLLHWPREGLDIPGILEMLMRAQQAGKTRRIGVANFPLQLLRIAVEEIRAPLFCNQIEYHVLLDQAPILDYLRAHNMVLIAHSPFAQGRLTTNATVARIAERHGVTPAQVALQWLLDQDDVATIVKAARVESQQQNLGALAVRLDDEDRAAIAALPKDRRFVNPPFAPSW